MLGKGGDVPLSENELKVLSEIEKNFYEHDSAFADRMRSETVYKHSGRNLKWAAVGFLAGFAFTVATFTTSVYLGLAGFLVMLASAVVFERNLRRMGKAGWQEITSQKKPGAAASMNPLADRFKGKFGKKD
ncbi:MAG: DUF3040 domain-containing protein [Acidimicrobiales bacterium]